MLNAKNKTLIEQGLKKNVSPQSEGKTDGAKTFLYAKASEMS